MLTPALADFTSYLLRRAYVRAAGHAADDLPPGRRPRDAVVLASLVMDPCSQKQLAERLHVDRTIVAQLIEPRHLSSLLAIAEMSPSQQDLARQLGVSGPVVVELIDELEGKALVERGRNPHDRRSYALVLTAEGRDVISRARAALATAGV